ncbi:MAG: hypothetical protein Q8P78_02140 [bacterium]|nr:hypothetical protein [bacterium]
MIQCILYVHSADGNTIRMHNKQSGDGELADETTPVLIFTPVAEQQRVCERVLHDVHATATITDNPSTALQLIEDGAARVVVVGTDRSPDTTAARQAIKLAAEQRDIEFHRIPMQASGQPDLIRVCSMFRQIAEPST